MNCSTTSSIRLEAYVIRALGKFSFNTVWKNFPMWRGNYIFSFPEYQSEYRAYCCAFFYYFIFVITCHHTFIVSLLNNLVILYKLQEVEALKVITLYWQCHIILNIRQLILFYVASVRVMQLFFDKILQIAYLPCNLNNFKAMSN